MHTYGIYALIDTTKALAELKTLYTCVSDEKRTVLPEVRLGTVKLDEELSLEDQITFARQFTLTLPHPFGAVLLRSEIE